MRTACIDDFRMGGEIMLLSYNIPMTYMWHWYDATGSIVMHVLCYGREVEVRIHTAPSCVRAGIGLLFKLPPGALSIDEKEVKKLLCG